MTVWPETLPQRPLTNGVTYDLGDNTIRTQMDRGVDKVRRRTIATPDTSRFSMAMSLEQWGILVDFYQNTIKAVGQFEMPDPLNDAVTRIVRFTAPPGIQYRSPGRVNVSIAIEILGTAEA